MKLLILGGTIFLGRHLVDCALARGHDVTLFNRGKHNPELFPNVEKIHGDRDGELNLLGDRTWDAVIDTCGYVPRIVTDSARRLADHTAHYTFISSISVFKDNSKADKDEHGEVCRLEDTTVETIDGGTYGGLKVLCEEAAEQALPGRTLNIRPGLIVGPHDPTDRFTYWPLRIAQGGDILTPRDHSVPVQVIDVRDLSDWNIRMIEQNKTGVYNATGPEYALSFGAMVEACRRDSAPPPNLIHVDEEWLEEKEVHAWSDIPVWIPDTPDMHGFARINCRKAISDGLTFRPIRDIAADTLDWARSRPQDYEIRAGLKPDRESKLLQEWNARAL
jgi:2'-hydroxyisoflavone reductase